jgi:hypothetical protein
METVIMARCPECGVESLDGDGLEAHFAARPGCRAGAMAKADLAAQGITICERCGVAILSEMQYTTDGWVHESCLTAEEREEIAGEERECIEACLHGNTDPREVGLGFLTVRKTGRGRSGHESLEAHEGEYKSTLKGVQHTGARA